MTSTPAQRRGISPRPRRPTTPPDPVQQAVDDYILMERKARAWDQLREHYAIANRAVLARMDELMQSL